jgi:hypothetical protein
VVCTGLLLVCAISMSAYLGDAIFRRFRVHSFRASDMPHDFTAEQLAEYMSESHMTEPPLCTSAKSLCLSGFRTKLLLRRWRQDLGRRRSDLRRFRPDPCPSANIASLKHEHAASSAKVPQGLLRNSSECSPIKIFVETAAREWLGHPVFLTADALKECSPQCALVADAAEADVVVYNLAVALSAIRPQPHQLRAVVNVEAHSINAQTLSHTDLLISFHEEADVQVSYAYALLGAAATAACRYSNRTAACLERAGAEWCRSAQASQSQTPFCRPRAPAQGEQALDAGGEEARGEEARGTKAVLWAAMSYYPTLHREFVRSGLAHERLGGGQKRGQGVDVAGEGASGVRQRGREGGGGALVATFMSASCERHDKFLQKLMQHIQVSGFRFRVSGFRAYTGLGFRV